MKHVRTHYKEQNRRKNSHMQCYRAGARRSRSTGMALAPADILYSTSTNWSTIESKLKSFT